MLTISFSDIKVILSLFGEISILDLLWDEPPVNNRTLNQFHFMCMTQYFISFPLRNVIFNSIHYSNNGILMSSKFRASLVIVLGFCLLPVVISAPGEV